MKEAHSTIRITYLNPYLRKLVRFAEPERCNSQIPRGMIFHTTRQLSKFKKLDPTPKYRRSTTRKSQRTRSEGGAKDQRRRLLRKMVLSPKISAIYGG